MDHITSKDGTVIGFRRSGTGPPLLLVHGAAADHQRWAAITPRFAEHFTVHAMDRRGRGASGDSPEYNLLREAEDVAAVVEALGESVSVLGHSYGGLCSLEAALLTHRISHLILYEPPIPNPASPRGPDIPVRMRALADRGELEAALELFMREVVRMPEHELRAYRQLPMWQIRIQLVPTISRELTFDQSYRFDAEKFASLQTPTLLLLGGDSPSFVRQATETVDAALPGSRVAILPGEQHIAMDTNPDLFASEVLGFLRA